MGRGVVSGLIWGLVLSIVVLAGVSLTLPLPQAPQPGVTMQGVTQGQAAPPPSPQAAAPDPQESRPIAMPAPQLPDRPGAPVVPPAQEDQPPAIAADAADGASDPAPQPDMQADLAAPPLPETETPRAAPLTAAVDPVPPLTEALAGTPPAELVSDPPARPVAIDMAQGAEAPPMPASRAEDGTAKMPPLPLMTQDRDAAPDTLDTAAPARPAAQGATVAGAETAVMATPDIAAAPAALADPAPARALPQVAPPMVNRPDPMTPPAAPQGPPPPATAARAGDLAAPVAQNPAPVVQQAQGALLRNAAAFDALPDHPLMSIILIEDADSPLSPEVLSQISFPVSFAIDPGRPDAAARAALLREAGFEVLILAAAAIPQGAAPSDVEISLAAAMQTIPQAVALLDSPDSRIQSDRTVLGATLAVLVESGHGLVAFPRNLNVAEQTARRDAVAAATAFRLLDDEDQRAPVITRYLDRAAFAAGQEGAVIVVGRSRPDTVTAVFSWALGGRGDGVALAPISAVLTRLAE